MIYFATSAFITLYLHEAGTEDVHVVVVARAQPLPAWHFLELEFFNTLRFRVFIAQMN